jgi:hypothetical protein
MLLRTGGGPEGKGGEGFSEDCRWLQVQRTIHTEKMTKTPSDGMPEILEIHSFFFFLTLRRTFCLGSGIAFPRRSHLSSVPAGTMCSCGAPAIIVDTDTSGTTTFNCAACQFREPE